MLAQAGYSGTMEGSRRAEDLFLDTQGGKLAAGGERLRLRRERGSWSWRYDPIAGPSAEAPAQAYSGPWPLRAGEGNLPVGAAGIVGGNGLFPGAWVRLATSFADLTSPSGTRLRLVSETPILARGPFTDERSPLKVTLLTVRLLEGAPSELQHLAAYLRDFLRLAPEERDLCSMALDALGRPEPGGHPPESLRVGPENTLAVVARKIVSQQAIKMRANTEGTRLDLDPEYLHDLRVATRRLRSALKLLGSAVGRRRTESLRREISWIGGLLGEVRDLDVFMGNLATHAGRLAEAGRVTKPLEEELAARRRPALDALVAGLQGRRYASLLGRLETLGASRAPVHPRGFAGIPAEVAGPTFIGKAYRRVVQQGRTAVSAQEPAALHRLRILFKRLRYASEFFAPAMGGRLDPLIRAMVKFQDCLGEHQDAAVAAQKIDTLAREMAAGGSLPVEALLDLGSLIQVQREIAMDRRARLADLWRKFDRASVRRCLAGDGEVAGDTPLKPSAPTRRRAST